MTIVLGYSNKKIMYSRLLFFLWISSHELFKFFLCISVLILSFKWKLRRISATFLSQGGLPMYVATRGLYNLQPPTIFVSPCIKEDVEKLFDIHRSMSEVELNFNLVALDVGMQSFNFFYSISWLIHTSNFKL